MLAATEIDLTLSLDTASCGTGVLSRGIRNAELVWRERAAWSAYQSCATTHLGLAGNPNPKP